MIRNFLRLLTTRTLYSRVPHKNDHLELVSKVKELSIEIERLKRNLNLEKKVSRSLSTLALRLEALGAKTDRKNILLKLVSEQKCLIAIDERNNFYLTPENDQIITPEINQTGYWEKKVSLFLEQILPTKNIFIVIGANFGYHVIQQAKNYPQLKIIAVEPHPKTFELLRINCDLNNLEVDLFNLAITDSKELIALYESEFNGGNNRTEPFGESKIVGYVNSDSITNFIKKLTIAPDVYLIDMQGNEIETVLSIFNLQTKKTICIFEFDTGNKLDSHNYYISLGEKISDKIHFSILDEGGHLQELTKDELLQKAKENSKEDLIIVANN